MILVTKSRLFSENVVTKSGQQQVNIVVKSLEHVGNSQVKLLIVGEIAQINRQYIEKAHRKIDDKYKNRLYILTICFIPSEKGGKSFLLF